MATKYQEHEKLSKVSKESQAIGEFLDWLQTEKGYTVGEYNKFDELRPVRFNIQDILAEFYSIDLNKLEAEKRAMLDLLRKEN